MKQTGWIEADWPAPDNVRAGTSTRQGGVSTGSYASLNLAMHVGDAKSAVEENRRRLQRALNFSVEPQWLEQVHGCDVSTDAAPLVQADAAATRTAARVCVVMTADCLPVLFCDRAGTCVAAAHAGWRGLAGGVLARTLDTLPVKRDQVLVWLGPAIGPDVFEVGDEVRQAFLQAGDEFRTAFQEKNNGKWLMDIYLAARLQLHKLGVDTVYGGGLCTYSDAQRFYSYRRDRETGRMASLIWMTSGD